MKNKSFKNNTEKAEPKKKKEKVFSDIIQKIVDVHATADEVLSEMSYSCNSREECKGK